MKKIINIPYGKKKIVRVGVFSGVYRKKIIIIINVNSGSFNLNIRKALCLNEIEWKED